MNIYRLYIALIVTILLTMTTTVTAENIFTIADETEDVLDKNADLVSYPDLDIKEISVDRNGNQIDLSLKLNENGKILNSGFIVAYTVYLTTSNNLYEIIYGYSETDFEEIALDGITITAYEDLNSGSGVDVNIKSDSGVGTNELKISFDLLNDYEKLISIDGIAMYMSDLIGTETYIDEVMVNNSNFPSVDAGDSYSGKAGNKITFEGSLGQGNPGSYNWLWTIEDTSIIKEGQTVEHTFITPGSYTGTLYVYDGQGGYAEDSFTLQITGSSSNGGNNGGSNNEPGFEIIVMFVAIAIALMILRKKK
jgi:hypothetical protein